MLFFFPTLNNNKGMDPDEEDLVGEIKKAPVDMHQAALDAESIIHRLSTLVLEVQGKINVSSDKEDVWAEFRNTYLHMFKRLRRNAWYKSLVPNGSKESSFQPRLARLDRGNGLFRLPFIRLALACFPDELASQHNEYFWTLVSAVFFNHFERRYVVDNELMALGNNLVLFCKKMRYLYSQFDANFKTIRVNHIPVSEGWFELVEEHLRFCTVFMPGIVKLLKFFVNVDSQSSVKSSDIKYFFSDLESEIAQFVKNAELAPYVVIHEEKQKKMPLAEPSKPKEEALPLPKEEMLDLDPDFEIQQTQEVDTFDTLYGEGSDDEDEAPLEVPPSLPSLYMSPKK